MNKGIFQKAIAPITIQGRKDSRGITPIRVRKGAVLVEFLLAFPIFMLVLIAIAEFGLIFGNMKHVAMASRMGALTAAEQTTLDIDAIRAAVDETLAGEGLGSACKIVVEHNVPSSPASPLISDPAGCICPNPAPPPFPQSGYYVRVTVTVPLSSLTPDLLCCFGFSTQDRVMQEATTYQYERLPTP